MGEILYWLWVVFVVGGTIAVNWHSPAGMVEGLIFNSLLYLLPAYLIRNHYRKKAKANIGSKQAETVEE